MPQESTRKSSVLQESTAARRISRLGTLSARSWFALAVCLALLLLAVVPPSLSLNRYQHRVTISMSQVLGRPVHLDRVTLKLLPLPSFTLENLVIEDAPDFGSEPLIRANTVSARLRVSSLWRHRVEFSRISFTDPSVNLVHLSDGRWNLEGVLLQASRVDAAPTSQARAGGAPRFPYIEATGARINLKLDQEKTPFSLTDADFALWLPEAQEWKMRISGKPARTDTSVSETGLVQIEAGLHHATTFAEVPLTADATWSGAPLGATSRIFSGRDVGMRGQVILTAHLRGVLSAVQMQLHLQIADLHRSDFVPEHSIAVDLQCTAVATHAVHSLENLRCNWPLSDAGNATLALTGTLPNLLDLRSAQLQIGTPVLPASTLVAWLHVLSTRVPGNVKAAGFFTGSAQYTGRGSDGWTGAGDLQGLLLSGGGLGEVPLSINSVELKTATQPAGNPLWLQLSPTELELGGRDPAILEGSANAEGYTLHLSGMASISRLVALAATIPEFGDGLLEVLPKNRTPGPTRLDLTAQRAWGEAQVWTDTLSQPPASVHRSLQRGRPQKTRSH